MATIHVWQPWASLLGGHADFRTSGGTSLSFQRNSGAALSLSLRQTSSPTLLQYLRFSGVATRSRHSVVAAAAEEHDEMGKKKKKRLTLGQAHHAARLRKIKETTIKALKAILLIKRQHDEGGEVTADMLTTMQVLIGQARFAVDSAVSKGTLKKSSGKKKKAKLTTAKQKLEIYLGCYDPDKPPKSRLQKERAAVMDARRPGHSVSTTESLEE